VTVHSSKGIAVSDTATSWNSELLPHGARFVHPGSALGQTFDLNSGALVSSVQMSYAFDALGNNVFSGERTSDQYGRYDSNKTREFDIDPLRWRCSLIRSRALRQSLDAPVIERNETLTHDPETMLVVRRVRDGGTAFEIAESFTLDPYGNHVATATSGADFAPRTTRAVFDSRGVYGNESTSPLGHVLLFRHSLPFGSLLAAADFNGLTTFSDLDAMGRPVVAPA
jgi:hypothetical protein